MPLRVQAWLSNITSKVIAGDFPVPQIGDDRDSFPVDVVVRVTDWLQSTINPQTAHEAPSNVVIQLFNRPEPGKVEGEIHLGGVSQTAFHELRFSRGMFEIVLRDKKLNVALGTYHYVGAQCIDGRVIALPQCVKFEAAGQPQIQIYNSAKPQ